MSFERKAEPGELCTCGRQAMRVYQTEKFGEVGACLINDGGRGAPAICPFCGEAKRHEFEDETRCPRYELRPFAVFVEVEDDETYNGDQCESDRRVVEL